MSNFFGALDSDDDEPTKVVAKTTTTAAASGAKADAGARLTGADKKNRDQKRHGATRGAKEGEAPKKHGGFDRKSGAGRAGGQSKDGRGKFGFGSADQEAEDAAKGRVIDDVDAAAADDADVAPAAPVVPTMSMEDFMAQRSAEKSALSKLAGTKKVRQVKAEGEVAGKATVEVLLDATVEAKADGPKGLSKRLQAKNVVSNIKFGFKSNNQDEDRPPRREFNDRDNGDRERKPRTDGDRPERKPRADGDRPERKPRTDGDRPPRDGAKRDFKPKRDGDRPQRDGNRAPNAGGDKARGPRGPNLGDANAFPSL